MERKEVSPAAMIGNLVRVMKRRRWWLILPAVVVVLSTVTIVTMLPDKFESRVTLVVVQQKIAQRFVEPTMNASASDAFSALSREILSRTQLSEIIRTFNLYPEAVARGISLDLLAEKLRGEIDIDPQDMTRYGEISSFKIAFRATSPTLAQNVTRRLADLFIEENLRTRSGKAATTTRFLADQIETARQRLAKQEEKVRDYKRTNVEGLPQQQQVMLATLADLRGHLQATTSGVARIQQERNSIRTLLSNYIGVLKADRQSLLSRFTSKHPDVAKKDEEIGRAELLSLKLQKGGSAGNAVSSSPGFDSAQLGQLRAQVEANLAEMENLVREEQRLTTEISRQQSMLKMTPVREQELAELLRDYDLYKKDYEDLLGKQLNAQLSATLEERNEGQQFRLVDPPTLPMEPSSPKRLVISLAAMAVGVVIGALLALLIDVKANAHYTEAEIRDKYRLPIVSAIPYVRTPAEEKSLRWRRTGEWLAGAAAVLVVAVAEAYVYWRG